MCECFVLLAFGTPFNVIFDPFGHAGPPGNSLGGVDGPVLSCVCCRWFVMYQVEEVPLKFVIWWEHHLAFVFLEAYGWFHCGFDEFKLIAILPFFHELWLSLLFLSDSFLYRSPFGVWFIC